MVALRLHIRGRVASLSLDMFCRLKNSGTNQIAVFKWPLSETRSYSVKLRMAGVHMEESERIQACILQAVQEFGYHSMKQAQVEVVLNFVKGRDVFAILPTGFGKSLCYATSYI